MDGDGVALESFFATCPTMLYVAQVDGVLRLVSDALRTRLGHRFDDPMHLAALASDKDSDSLDAFLGAFDSAEARAEHACVLHASEADGEPLTLRCVGRRGADGLIHGEVDVDSSVETQIELKILRTIISTLDIAVWAVDAEGCFVFHDGKGIARTGLVPGQLLGANCFELYPESSIDTIKRALDGEPSYVANEAHGIHWNTWSVPMTLADGRRFAVGISLDVSERVTIQNSLEQQLGTIKSQQHAIYELSAPVLNVWDCVLAVPLIGIMDAERTDELTDRLLAAAHRSQTKFAILDLTGVETVDTSIAAHVLRLLKSLELLGVDGLVTGVSPEVARTMVGVGIDFERVQTHRTLREGLRHCMRVLFESPL